MSRPELGPVAVGDEVFFRDGGPRNRTTTPATIVKVGRTWLTLRTPSGREWRMVKDKQTTNAGYSSDASFATAAQVAYDDEVATAHSFLREQGISIQSHSPWYGADGTRALAKLLREALG